MFHDKKNVDRHVQEIFRKLRTEKERTLRCYNIAKLYHQVGDYESAKRYVSTYLEVREESSGAHKLLGQSLEALDQKEAALAEYKCSLEIDGKQDDLVLKVCELLADTDVGMDVSRARYWLERADRQFPHHPVVFQLKEKLLTVDRPNDNAEDLVALITSELSARPMDVTLRVKFLRYHMEKNNLEDAYKHALGVESSHAFRDNIIWYQAICELLGRCKDSKRSDWTFWMLYVSTLERLAALSIKEQGDEPKKSIPEAAQAVLNFDQGLAEAELHKKFSNDSTFAEHMFGHMWGQLHFHLACLLLRKTKREHRSWSEAGRLCSPLLLCALHTNPPDPTALWATRLKEQCRAEVNLWYREASYRCSQAGHVLQDYARDDTKRFLDKIDKFCTGAWRERVYQRIFVSRVQQQMIKSSHFANHTTPNPPLRLCTHNELKHHDEVSEEVWPGSLHHQVWLGIKSRPHHNHHNNSNGPHPHQYSHIFPELQFSVYNLSLSAAESLSRLDIDAFLNAAVLCASVVVEEQQRSDFWSPDRLPTLPADITNALCSSTQENWWEAAYKMYREQEGVGSKIGEIRQILQRGLEVVRCIDNHGLHPCILVHLARLFHHRVKTSKEKNEEHPDIPALEARCELYWSAAVPLLERLQNNQAIRSTGTKLFEYKGKDMNNVELTNALEEGRLLLAQRYLRDKQYEQAIEALQALKCPEASFQQGQIYKTLADELVSSLPKESLTSEMRSQHIIMLSKARDCFYLTLDRLRSPGTNPKHPLNSELCTHISGIENELKRIDPDVWRNDLNRNECDELSDESYSSAHSGELPVINTSYGLGSSNVHKLNTPHRSTHRTPNQSSTPCRPQHQDILDLSRNRTEARPSPERLDAQIRQLLHSRDNVMQTIMDQYKTLLDTTKAMGEQFEELKKEMGEKLEELRKEIADLRKEIQKQRPVAQAPLNPTLEEDLYVLGEEDYGDLNYGAPPAVQPFFFCPTPTFPGNMFPPAQRYQPLPPFPAPRIEPARNYVAPPTKPPPVNVVITTSDILPTTVPPVQPTFSVTIPLHHRLGGIPQPANVPHNYQISMPLQATIPTTVNLPPLYTTLTNTIPTNTSVTEKASGNTSILSTSVANESNEWYVETEHDPIPDFVPVVPLPAEVEITTGEEGETTLYCAKAKLFRFVEKEWKERGVGYVKLLRNAEGKVRLLMRRDQVLKICANHLLRPDMELTKMPNTDKALIWVANDFADEEVKLEKLCIKFKTEDEAANFKLNFDKAKASVPISIENVHAGNKTDEKSNNLEAPLIVSVTKETANIPVVLGGFSFTTKPIIQEQKSTDSSKSTQKSNEVPKPSPFASFSFTKPESVSDKEIHNVSSTQQQKIVSDRIPAEGTKPSTTNAINVLAQPKDDGAKQKTLAEMFKPAIGSWECGVCYTRNDASSSKCLSCETPLPNAVKSTVIQQEKNDINKQNKPIAEMFKPAVGSWECGVCYIRNDASNSKCLACQTPLPNAVKSTVIQQEKNDINKQNKPLAEMFKPAVGSWECGACYTRNDASSVKCMACEAPVPNAVKSTVTQPEKIDINKQSKSLAEMFKPAVGSWECGACYSRNDASNINCLACESPSSNAVKSIATQSPAIPKPSAPFGSATWDCKSCSTKNYGYNQKCEACGNGSSTTASQTTIPTEKVPLSQLFKLTSGSWECNVCMVHNTPSNNYCVACDSPKDPSMPVKPKTGGFNIATSSASVPSFSFGIPQTTPKDPIGGFTFGKPKSDAKAAGDSAKISAGLTFGSQSLNSSATFSFGNFQNLGVAPNHETPFTFGSPGKSFDFQFQAKSPVKSPGGCETSEDEVAESEDVYFAPVIPLPDKVDVKTGEENEEVLYSHRAKLFRYESTGKEWKERGLGDIKLLKHRKSGKLRLLMRRDQVLKLCLNHFVTSDMEFTPKDDKTWLWCAADYSEGDISHEKFACRFKTAEIAQEFKTAIDNAKGSPKTPVEKSAPKKTEKSPVTIKKNLFGRSSSTSDVEIVYEATVTPEEKAAASELQLPENFYAYKRLPDCPGCRGCKDIGSPPISENSDSLKPVTALLKPETPKPFSNIDVSRSKSTIFSPPKLTAVSQLGITSAPSLPASEGTAITCSGLTEATPLISTGPEKIVPFSFEKPPVGNVFGNISSTTSIPSTTSSTIGMGFTPRTTISFGTPPTTSWSNIFGGSALTATTTSSPMTFGMTAPKTSGFVFGLPSGLANTSTTSTVPISGFGLFGPTSDQANTSTTSAVPILGSSTTSTNVFSFGGTNEVKTTDSGTEAKPFKDLKICSPASLTTPTTQPALNIFAGSGNRVFGNTAGVVEITTGQTEIEKPTIIKGSTIPTFGVPASIQANPIVLETVTNISETKKEDAFSFLPTENAASFSTLAAKAPQQPAFQKDPNFSFAGAGSTVFGVKQTQNTQQSQSKNENTEAQNKEGDDEEGEQNVEEHDPHFEPIVPLPDAIEVRTGEEDEEKIFCQRAKLYRYVNATKEWKERGVGEMKLLHHVAHGTYRLLLRREQVHKVVCNLLLTADQEFNTLNTSDRAWCWAGMNYAEEEPAVEQLAVRFKYPEIAAEFKDAIDKAQQALRNKQNTSQVNKSDDAAGAPEVGEHNENENENDNENEDEDEDELDEEDEEEEHSIMFEKRATLMAQEIGGTAWKNVAMGDLKVLYDHNIFGARIVLEADSTGDILSNTVISMQTEMQVNGKECTWSAIDYALEPPVKRNLKSIFSSLHVAQEMFMIFEEGQGYAREAEIIEPEYYIPEEE